MVACDISKGSLGVDAGVNSRIAACARRLREGRKIASVRSIRCRIASTYAIALWPEVQSANVGNIPV